MLCCKRDSIKPCGSRSCDTEVMTCKMADAKGDNTDPALGVHQDAVSTYDSVCCGINEAIA